MSSTQSSTAEWYLDSRNIARLVRYLEEHGDGFSARRSEMLTEITDILEKPWHWTAEYEEMLAHERETAEKQAGPGLCKAELRANDKAAAS